MKTQEIGASGFKFKLFGYHCRLWRYGYDWEKGGVGRSRFWPWIARKYTAKQDWSFVQSNLRRKGMAKTAAREALPPTKDELLEQIQDSRWLDIVQPIQRADGKTALRTFRLALEEAYACGVAMGIEKERTKQ